MSLKIYLDVDRIQELDGAFDESSVLNKHLSELRLQQSRHAQVCASFIYFKRLLSFQGFLV